MRRFGEQPLAGISYRPRPGAYAIIERGGMVLVTHQSMPESEFQLPGGGVDPGESPVTALHREVMEETGWRVAAPRKMGVFRRYVFMPEYDMYANKICSIYVAQPVRKICDPTEVGHEAHWMPIEEASQLVANPGDRFFLKRFMQLNQM